MNKLLVSVIAVAAIFSIYLQSGVQAASVDSSKCTQGSRLERQKCMQSVQLTVSCKSGKIVNGKCVESIPQPICNSKGGGTGNCVQPVSCKSGKIVNGKCVEKFDWHDSNLCKYGKMINMNVLQNGGAVAEKVCVRNIEKCTAWESPHVCKTCEAGYHLEWYGEVAKICYPNEEIAKAICEVKNPSCKFTKSSGNANNTHSGYPWVDCGDDADNVWWYYFSNGKWIPNGKKGNPTCK